MRPLLHFIVTREDSLTMPVDAEVGAPISSAPAASRRRLYLDWLRGLAVLLMIAAHLFDSWTGIPSRDTGAYRVTMIVGGMGTVLFLLLAGVSVGLSAGSKWRRSGDPHFAAMAVARRGLEIFALAFLFRLQAWLLGWSWNPWDLLKVDILNIMGPSIVAAALIWRMAKTAQARAAALATAAAAAAFLAPVVRAANLDALPDPVQAYIVPTGLFSGFTFFPWSAFVFAGASLGVAIDAARTARAERRLNVLLALAGTLMALGAYAASHLPALHAGSYFWSSSPAFFFIRLGVSTITIAAAYSWSLMLARRGSWSPLMQLGRTSLFIYWIHVELIYGLISKPMHYRLTLTEAALAYVLFTGLMLLCSLFKDRLVQRHRLRRSRLLPRPER
jgi:uncharacterized membrane protein